MCDICYHTPCLSRCPNADEPETIGECCVCGYEVYDYEDCYEMTDGLVHERCEREYMKQFKRIGA